MDKLLDFLASCVDWILDYRACLIIFVVSSLACIAFANSNTPLGTAGGAAGFGAIAGCSLISAVLLRLKKT